MNFLSISNILLSKKYNIPFEIHSFFRNPNYPPYAENKEKYKIWITVSIYMSVCLYVTPPICFFMFSCAWKLALIPAVVSQNVTNKTSLVCVTGEIYAFLVI